jgi:hypothetical protein
VEGDPAQRRLNSPPNPLHRQQEKSNEETDPESLDRNQSGTLETKPMKRMIKVTVPVLGVAMLGGIS